MIHIQKKCIKPKLSIMFFSTLTLQNWNTVDPLMNGPLTYKFQKEWKKAGGPKILVHNGSM